MSWLLPYRLLAWWQACMLTAAWRSRRAAQPLLKETAFDRRKVGAAYAAMYDFRHMC
jgi:hypothetical protein